MSKKNDPANVTEPNATQQLEEEILEPPMYKVLLHNDDYTPMEFVILLLIYIFNKSPDVAEKIMLNVHNSGIGLCGVYTREIAETKVNQVHEESEKYEYPLRASIERE